MLEPKRIWWARPRKLCALERPGGGGRSHRADRRAGEIEYLKSKGVRLVISVMGTRHNLAAYDAAGLAWRHVPLSDASDGAGAFEELLAFLEEALRSPGAVAAHGDRRTDFVGALCAAHLHTAKDVDPAASLAAAVRAGLEFGPEACALVGVDPVALGGALSPASGRRASPRPPRAAPRARRRPRPSGRR